MSLERADVLVVMEREAIRRPAIYFQPARPRGSGILTLIARDRIPEPHYPVTAFSNDSTFSADTPSKQPDRSFHRRTFGGRRR